MHEPAELPPQPKWNAPASQCRSHTRATFVKIMQCLAVALIETLIRLIYLCTVLIVPLEVILLSFRSGSCHCNRRSRY